MCGSDGSFDSMSKGMSANFDGGIIAPGTVLPAGMLVADL
jgi:hypothetical protein